jgi:capsular exopolysaccharide synthesis family protein
VDAKGALHAVRKHWLLVTVAVILGICAGGYVVFSATPRYMSSVVFFVSTPASDDASALAADQFATRRVNSYVRLVRSDKLANMVINDTQLHVDTTTITHEVSATADLNTVLLKVKVIDPSRGRSLRIASSIATQFPQMVGEIDTVGSKSQNVRLAVVSGPRLSRFPIRPSKTLNLGLGLIAGLLVGIGIAVLREVLDATVRSQEVLRETAGHPVLGATPYDSAAKSEPLLIGGSLHSVRAESFRQLRTNLQFMNVDQPTRVIVVTSSVAAEGKSTTSANLALVFAETGQRTLLVEADMRRPRVTEYLSLERSVGLSNVLAGQVQVDEVLQDWGEGNLSVLAGGTAPPNPSEILGSHGMLDLMATLRERFDIIIVDTPPLLPVTDAAVASVLADGVVVVVRYGKTTRAQVASAMRSLEAVDARILGTVLTFTPAKVSATYGGYDGYGYYEDPGHPLPVPDERVQVDGSTRKGARRAAPRTPADVSRAARQQRSVAQAAPSDSGRAGNSHRAVRGLRDRTTPGR